MYVVWRFVTYLDFVIPLTHVTGQYVLVSIYVYLLLCSVLDNNIYFKIFTC
jgi:hypothetical protein